MRVCTELSVDDWKDLSEYFLDSLEDELITEIIVRKVGGDNKTVTLKSDNQGSSKSKIVTESNGNLKNIRSEVEDIINE